MEEAPAQKRFNLNKTRRIKPIIAEDGNMFFNPEISDSVHFLIGQAAKCQSKIHPQKINTTKREWNGVAIIPRENDGLG